jgi:outer membrane autotransporter protein
MTGSAYQDALDSISPARSALYRYALDNAAFFMSDYVSSRLTHSRLLDRLHLRGGSELSMLVAGPITRPPQQYEPCYKGNLWISPFGNLSSQDAQDQTPSFDMTSGGILAGGERFFGKHMLLGLALGYAKIKLSEDQSLGHEHIDDFVASLYSSFLGEQFFMDLAVWGGYNRTKEVRHIYLPGISETAKGKINGWQVVPHLLAGIDFKSSENFYWEPYVQADWACNFHDDFTETGAGIFNMHQSSDTNSFLRSEGGLAAIQTCKKDAGGFFLARESVSYVNKKPFGLGKTQAAIVGAPGGFFTVETLTDMQNLVSATAELAYETANQTAISLLYEGEFGSGFISNSLLAKLSTSF